MQLSVSFLKFFQVFSSLIEGNMDVIEEIKIETINFEDDDSHSLIQELRVCRVCLAGAPERKLYNFHDIKCSQTFGEFTGTTVHIGDGLPQYICCFCASLLKKSMAFRDKCLRTLVYLQNLLAKSQDQLTNSDIKKIDRRQFEVPLYVTDTLLLELVSDLCTETKDTECQAQGDTDEEDTKSDLQFNEPIINDDIYKDNNVSDPIECKKENGQPQALNENTPNIADASKLLDKGNSKCCTRKRRASETTKKPVKKKKSDDTEEAECGNKKRTKVKAPRTKHMGSRNSNTDEDYERIGRELNVEVVVLSKEEQVAEVEERRGTQAYLQSQYKCEICYRGYVLESSYKRHMKWHDPNNGDQVCDICKVRYHRRARLMDHIRRHRLQLKCKICNYICKLTFEAKKHHQWHEGLTYECKFCNKVYNKHSTYFNHVRECHTTMTCKLCGLTVAGTRGLEAHNEKEHQMKTPTRCQQYTVYRSSKQTKAGVNKWICEVCARSHHSPASLAAHQRVHTGEKPYHCPTCPKRFSSANSLKLHIYTHTGERPYKCTLCEESFKSPSQLWKHKLLAHTKERPHKCHLCEKTYVVANDLKMHIQIVHMNIPRRPPNRRKRNGKLIQPQIVPDKSG